MADKIFFKTGSASSLPTTKTAGQLLFAIDGTTGSIYLDKDSKTRIKFNADAVKLATPRSINGTTFDGSSDITTANWGTARNISISDATGANTGTAVSVNGSQAVTLKLPATLVATLKGNADTATKATSADKATVSESCTGNAATATKLKSGVSINGSTFDGSAGITTAKWGTARIITVSDNTGDHTQTNSGIDGSANFTIKLPATITATLIGNADSATYATTAGTANSAKACTGNAATATKLKAGVAINGTNFDGSTAITTTNWGTARNFTIKDADSTNSGAAVSVNGSGAVTLLLPSTIKANITGKATSAGTADSATTATTATTCTGNAATATKLATPRNITISGTASSSIGAFDGSANTTIYMPLTIQGFNEIKTKKLTITSTEQVSHLAFSRGGWNYFTAPTSGSFAFAPDGREASGTGATLTISTTEVIPGNNNNTINLGSSSYKWKNVYATTFTGALSGNATTATTLATPRALRISDTANSTSTASFNGSADATLYIPTTIKGFTSIESDKFAVNDKVTLQYNTTNECLEFVFA